MLSTGSVSRGSQAERTELIHEQSRFIDADAVLIPGVTNVQAGPIGRGNEHVVYGAEETYGPEPPEGLGRD
jgi:hypothetical protein